MVGKDLTLKYGIEETTKAIHAAAGGFIGLKDIDWHKVAQELSELDAKERKDLFFEITEILIKIVGFAAEYKSIIQLIIKFLK